MVFFLWQHELRVLLVRFGLSPFNDERPRGRAARGSSLQRAPRNAPCQSGLLRARERNDTEPVVLQKKHLKTVTGFYLPTPRSGRDWRASCGGMKHDRQAYQKVSSLGMFWRRKRNETKWNGATAVKSSQGSVWQPVRVCQVSKRSRLRGIESLAVSRRWSQHCLPLP